MINLYFNAEKQILTRTDREDLASSSREIHKCNFNLSNDWDDMQVTAVFKYMGRKWDVLLTDNACTVPAEVLEGQEGFTVGLYGTNGDQVITSTLITVPVSKGANASGGGNAQITPSMFDQIMAKIEEIEEGQIDPESIEAAIDEYLRENPDAIINPTEVYNAITRSRLINLIPKYTEYRDGLEKTDATPGVNYYVLAPGHMGNQEDRFEYGPIVITVTAPGASRSSVYYLIQRAGYLPAGKYKLKNAWQTNDPNISIIYGYSAQGAEHVLAEVTTTNEIAEFEITQEIIDAGYDQVLYIKLSEGAVGGEYFPLLTYGDVTDFANVPEGYVDNNEELTKATLSLKADTDDLKDRVTELEEQSGDLQEVEAKVNTLESKFKSGLNLLPDHSLLFGQFYNVIAGQLVPQANAAYNSSAFISVEPGHTYKLVKSALANANNLAMNVREMADGVTTSGVINSPTLRANESYTATLNTVCFSYLATFEDELKYYALVDVSKTTEYQPYGDGLADDVTLGNTALEQVKEICLSDEIRPLYGKKILSLGDSFTWQNLYGKFLEKATGATQRGRGQNGNVLMSFCNDTYTGPDGNPVTETFDATLLEDYDIVTIMGGTNDYGHGSDTLGAITDQPGDNTIYGSVKYLIDKILTLKPSVKIFFCTQPYRLKYTDPAPGGYAPNSNGLTMANIAEAIKDCCAYYGIPCFDYYTCSGWNEWTVKESGGTIVNNIYTNDGLHPKDGAGNGADLLGTAFGSFINQHAE